MYPVSESDTGFFLSKQSPACIIHNVSGCRVGQVPINQGKKYNDQQQDCDADNNHNERYLPPTVAIFVHSLYASFVRFSLCLKRNFVDFDTGHRF